MCICIITKRNQEYNVAKTNELKIDDESFSSVVLKKFIDFCWKICGKQKALANLIHTIVFFF